MQHNSARDLGNGLIDHGVASPLSNHRGIVATVDGNGRNVALVWLFDHRGGYAILVIDATVGRNALSQVELFGRVAGVTGLVMTKLDGTARGGILVAIADKFGLPIHFIGVGESADDLEPFEARDFARAIAGFEEETAA